MARLIKADDGILDVLVKVITGAGIGFGVWAYFYTVHPVFTKESELLSAKNEVETLRGEGIRLEGAIDQQEERLAELDRETKANEERIESLQSYGERKAAEVAALELRTSRLEAALDQTRIESVKQMVMRHMDKVAREAIDAEIARKWRGSTEEFDMQQRCLDLATQGLEGKTHDDPEYVGYLVLQSFARTKLEPGITEFGPIYDIMTYVQFDPDALQLIRAESPLANQ